MSKLFKDFFKSEKALGKVFATITMFALVFTMLSPGTFAAFWRATSPDPYSSAASPGSFLYGYGYGSAGWGWGYGYAYNYSPTSNAKGYYNYSNPTTVTSIGSGEATIVGAPTAATSATMTSTVAFSSGGATIVLPSGLQITKSGGGTFNASAIGAGVGTILSSQLGSNTLLASLDFGSIGYKLLFNIPVQITIPVPGVPDGTSIYITVKHYGEGFSTSSLSTSPAASCTNGVASPMATSATASGGQLVIYTCAASSFAAYTSGGGTTTTTTAVTPSGGSSGSGTWWMDNSKKTESPVEKAVKTIMGFDDIAGHWAEAYIKQIYELGIVSGKSEGVFAPNDEITRAELTKIATKAFGISIDPIATYSPFADVSTSSWYAPYIIAAKEKGIIKGYENNVFSPNGKVNRAEALKILLLSAGLGSDDSIPNFPDVDENAWFARYVGYAQTYDIVAGYPDGTFGPGKRITRAEVAKIVVKILGMK
ncbi:S-layer homology domain-containing protein [Candidatus Peregrinibacteria bacterium]|nr:S-layer homology domain-containing protein [Candidatus Peregrinibacteria bacterium]